MAVGRFPRTSSAGPSGLRPSHLQDSLRRPGQGTDLVSALSVLARVWISASLPAHHAGMWCSANLIPLVKKDSGVRPVAVGETLRRLVGKVLLSSSHAKLQVDGLRPLQVGTGVRNACESVAMATEALATQLDPSSGWALAQIDFRNAFNTLDHMALLREASTRTPA